MFLAIVKAVAVLGGLGVVFGLVLAVASKVFAVEEDPRKEPLTETLPGANCGGCGFAGCSAYAEAVLAGTASIGACPVGGAEVAEKMAAIMGVDNVGPAVRQVAFVRCTGGGKDHLRYHYEGVQDCLAASRVSAGGELACQYGCLALGSCVKACDFGAIQVANGSAQVDEEKCKGCLKCVSVCPRGLISVVPYGTAVQIPCASKDKGAEVRKGCESGCIGCSLCVKACPVEAVSVANNLASIDYSKCIGCGACAAKCPRKLIHVDSAKVVPAAAGAE